MEKQKPKLIEALMQLEQAIIILESSIDNRSKQQGLIEQYEIEIQNLNIDRSLLAQDLEKAENQAQKLKHKNKEASRRLVQIMEMLRALLAQKTPQ